MAESTTGVAIIPAESMVIIVFGFLFFLIVCGGIRVVFERYQIEPPSVHDSLLGKIGKSQQFWMRSAFVAMAAIIGALRIEGTCGRENVTNYCDNWHLMYWYGIFLIATANVSYAPFEFYLGEGISFSDTANFFLWNKEPPSVEEEEQASRQRWTKIRQGEGGDEDATGSGSDATTGNVKFKTLMPSVFITWIFAKSIRNSAWLGGRYGVLGGLAYTSWYLSFFSTAVVCYILRTKYNFKSLPTAVYKNYGAVAVILFQLCLFFRLFNEVWSNAGVVGGFYGATGSSGYWGAAWLSVLIPTVYVIMGGMRASLFSDVLQAGLAVLTLTVVLGAIGSDSDFPNAFTYEPTTLYPTGGWDGGWWACFLAGSIQGIVSYPFFDPVLSDRAFIGTPKTMVKSFAIGGLLAATFIFFFSFIGVYGAFYHELYNESCGCGDVNALVTEECPTDWDACSAVSGTISETSNVARILGYNTARVVEIFLNFIMITASMSTLDSTFTSTSKLVSLEFCGWLHLSGDKRDYSGPLNPQDLDNISSTHMVIARATMAFLAFVGTAFLGIEGDVMQATTAAGTCVMGIGAPIWFMTIWSVKNEAEGKPGWRQSPLAFIVPTIVGFFFGLSYWAQGRDGEGWTYDISVGSYYYSRFLGTNLVGHAVCIGLFFIFFAFHQVLPMLGIEYFPEVERETRATVIGRDGAQAGGKVVDAEEDALLVSSDGDMPMEKTEKTNDSEESKSNDSGENVEQVA